MTSVHLTGLVICRPMSSRILSGSDSGRPETAEMKVTVGGMNSISSRARRISSSASRMKGVWNGPETLRGIARNPRSRASSTARFTAPRSPETTTCSGAL